MGKIDEKIVYYETLKQYNSRCTGKSARVSDMDAVCPERKGYCNNFN